MTPTASMTSHCFLHEIFHDFCTEMWLYLDDDALDFRFKLNNWFNLIILNNDSRNGSASLIRWEELWSFPGSRGCFQYPRSSGIKNTDQYPVGSDLVSNLGGNMIIFTPRILRPVLMGWSATLHGRTLSIQWTSSTWMYQMTTSRGSKKGMSNIVSPVCMLRGRNGKLTSSWGFN